MDFLPPDDRRDRADRRTLGWTVALGSFVAAYAFSSNPLNIDLGPFLPLYVGLGFLVTAVALLHAVRWSFTHPAVRVVVTAVGALAITYCTWIITFFSLLAYDTDEAVLATQDDVRLVVVNGINLIDPIQRVELQRDLGPVSQATVVWQGRPGGNTFGAGVPLIARSYAYFSGPQEVTVTAPRRDGRACLYRTHFDLLTLEPEQPHNDGDLTGPGC